MTITVRLLKDCDIPCKVWKTYCDCCGPEPTGEWDKCFFLAGDEFDPEEYRNEKDISGLTLGVDYAVIKVEA